MAKIEAGNFRWFVIPTDQLADPDRPTVSELLLATDVTHLISSVETIEYHPNGDVID